MSLGWRWPGRGKPVPAGDGDAAGALADLARLPVGLNLRAINLTEGVRAALATAVILIGNHWLGWPSLAIAAIGAMLTCFCDVGGSVRRRLPPLFAFALLGGLTWGAFGLLRSLGLPFVVPAAALAILCNSLARVWGLPAQTVGNLLTVVLALALDRPLDLPAALTTAGLFTAGGLWAMLLTAVIWQVHPDSSAKRAVAEVWRRMAALSTDLRELLQREQVTPEAWESHARVRRRAVRDAIEQARLVVSEMVRSRGPLSRRGAQSLVQLEAAEQLFGALIGLSDELEHGTDPRERAAAGRLLRLLTPALTALARIVQGTVAARPARIEGVTRHILATADTAPGLRGLVQAIAVRLRIAAGLVSPEGELFGALAAEPSVPFRQRLTAPLTANLGWGSAVMRHAVRAAVVAAPIIAISLIWALPFEHWLTITVVLTLQPYFAATWQRALERIGGTVLGALIGGAIAFAPSGSLSQALLLFPLSIVGFSVRQVSYGTFIACLTPMIVILIEVVEPGQSPWTVAGLRILFTLAGGVIAVLGSMLLWPTWEIDRLRPELGTAIRAYARYADTAFAFLLGGTAAAAEEGRRAAGVANNNLEASVSRALQEPGHIEPGRLQATVVADAALRRIAGCLLALQHGVRRQERPDPVDWAAWRLWASGALAEVAEGRKPAAAAPETGDLEPLARLARAIELLGGTLPRT